VSHVVPTLRAVAKAVEAGADGLTVGSGEAGEFLDGPTMAAAFALGVEGVQLGTVMVTATESPVHPNWKQAIIDVAEADSVVSNGQASLALRALRTERTTTLEFDYERNAMAHSATCGTCTSAVTSNPASPCPAW
jgi:enoyl-[acyl-carrier protein] reductase II